MNKEDIYLSVGDPPLSIMVWAREKWNRTGVLVKEGERYAFEASGTWTDFFIKTDPNGFTTDDVPRLSRAVVRRFERKRRMPEEKWFCLVGCVAREGSPFSIGKWREYTIPEGQSGPLLCYANDVISFYWNNIGIVQLKVRRIE